MQQQQIAIVWSTIRSRSSSLRVQECTICSIDVSKSFVTRPFLFGTVDNGRAAPDGSLVPICCNGISIENRIYVENLKTKWRWR